VSTDFLDFMLGDAKGSGTGYKAAAKTVGAILVGVEASGSGAPLHQTGNSTVGQCLGGNMKLPSNMSEQGAASEPGALEPALDREYGARFRMPTVGNSNLSSPALLVGLTFPDQDDQSLFGHELEVFDVQPNEFGTTKSGGKPEEE
jgi:hypothetical protein